MDNFVGYSSLVGPPQTPETPKDWSFEPAKEIDFAVVRRLDDPEVPGLYQLRWDIKDKLTVLAKPGCKLCAGTGISRWRAHGRAANVCKCVRQGLEKKA